MGNKKTYLSADIILQSPLHIGNGAENDMSDAPVFRTLDGQLVIPGTALAGAMRAIGKSIAPWLVGGEPGWCKGMDGHKGQEPCGCLVCRLFGDVNPQDKEKSGGPTSAEESRASASHLWIYNAGLVKTGYQKTSIRDHVGIERQTGAANREARAKFDNEIIEPGNHFGLRLYWETLSPEEELLLGAILGEWLWDSTASRGYLGGKRSSGLGSFYLDEISLVEWNLDDKEQLLAYIQSDDPWQAPSQTGNGVETIKTWIEKACTKILENAESVNKYISSIANSNLLKQVHAGCWVTFEFLLEAKGLFLTNDPSSQAKSGFDHAPLFNWLSPAGGPVLPGSSLRGALRSQAEKILRTITTRLAIANGEDVLQTFLNKCLACDPLVRETDQTGPLSLASCDSLLWKNGIASDEWLKNEQLCLACQLFGSSRLGSNLIFEESCYSASEKQKMPVYKALDFLAIDRFTGGGLDRAKFDALALWKPCFKARIRIENPEPWQLGLLSLVLRDLEESMIPLGFGSAKGFGRVAARDWKVHFDYICRESMPWDLSLNESLSDVFEPDEVDYCGVYRRQTLVSEHLSDNILWQGLMEQWLNKLNDKIRVFERGETIRLGTDNYWAQQEYELYPTGVKINVD